MKSVSKTGLLLAFSLIALWLAGRYWMSGSTLDLSQPSPNGSLASNPKTPLALAKENRAPSSNGAFDQTAIADFNRQSSRHWQLRNDPFDGRVRSLSAGAISLAGETDRARAQDFILRFSKSLFGVDPKELRDRTQVESDRTAFRFNQYLESTRISGAALTLIFESGQLTRVQSDLINVGGAKVETRLISEVRALDWIRVHGMNPMDSASKSHSNSLPVTNLVSTSTESVLVATSQSLVPAIEMVVENRVNSKLVEKRLIVFDAASERIVSSRNLLLD